ncbi:peptidoglycan editing factor PgeF [Campylobacter sp. RM12916]|nr:peptidoglycan editing factor PgeF [Campylobacter sp. RM12916]MBE3609430.1 peptidoglycan editing factor PgeF [Campylobacter sp. RM12916]
MKFEIDDDRFLLGFTSKKFGLSKGAYAGLNLALHVGDDKECVLKNREILANFLGVKLGDLIFMEQIHSDKVEILTSKDQKLTPCDAVITTLKNTALCVMTADCSPVLIIDPVCEVICVIHAGRAGVMKKICTKAINLMENNFGCEAINLEVFVGANIKGSCYEVKGIDLGELGRYKFNDKFDMNMALRDEISSLGVTKIKFEPSCTHCDEMYFSYRREGVTGRFAGFVMMRG